MTPAARVDAPPATLTLSPQNFQEWRHVGGEAEYAWDASSDGATLTASGTAKRNGFLVSPLALGDFDLSIDVRIERGNSGLQFRSRVDEEANRIVGYQMEVDPTNRQWSGGIYEEGLRGWVAPPAQEVIDHHPFKVGEWNHYRVRCEGDHLQTWINGVAIADIRDAAAASGVVALQCHSGDTLIHWRNLTVTPLDAAHP